LSVSIAGLGMVLGASPLNVVDDAGVEWRVTTLDGWGGPTVRAAGGDRPGDHGYYQGISHYGARNLTLTGTLIGPTSGAVERAWDVLCSAVGLTDAPFQVNETIAKYLLVRQSGEPKAVWLSDTILEWQLGLQATDPRKYSVGLNEAMMSLADPNSATGVVYPRVYPGSGWGLAPRAWHILAVNAGNFESRPLLVFTGSCVNPAAVNLTTGNIVQLGLTIASGSWCTIDTDDRTVLLEGSASRRYALSRTSSWWVLQPGINEIGFYADTFSSDAQLSVLWRSAWV
jgi:hypothetical protein